MTHPVSIKYEPGREVRADGRRYIISHILDFDAVLAYDPVSQMQKRISIADLQPCSDIESEASITPELLLIDERDWDTARRRMKLIEPFLTRIRPPATEIYAAAKTMNVEGSTVYRWIRLYRSSGSLASLLPTRSNGGRGKSRLSKPSEDILRHAIDYYYLNKKQPTVEATCNEVERLCREQCIAVPSRSTIRLRINQLTEKDRLTRRSHRRQASDLFDPSPDHYLAGTTPLGVVQMDHTPLDVIVVDEKFRLPVGRPWLTLAMDVYTRMVVGFLISFDPPSASSAGLCMSHAILPKETWLAKRDIPNAWPVWGFPAALHLDNAKEFRGEMLRRACEQYGIEINFRPVRVPKYGGHIERLMGTVATKLRTLDGATFSNPSQRGEYDSEAEASMTLPELERWFGEYITGVYHKQFHSGINAAPIQRWHESLLGTNEHPPRGLPARPTDEDRVKLDFMPVVKRAIHDYGVEVDRVTYFSDVLRPYINQRTRNGPQQHIFRRDPRDISTIYFWDPQIGEYAALPYRTTTRPPMTLWELRAATKRAKDEKVGKIEEDDIFESHDRLLKQQERSRDLTKRQRRENERRKKRDDAIRIVAPATEIEAPFGRPSDPEPEPFEIFDV